jgi:isoleucyl-tRNA synthetase
LPASLALAFHPHFEYVLADDDHGNTYILARDLVGKVMQETGATLRVEHQGLPGKSFEGTRFRHPFLDREVPGVLADYVTLEQGTGVVHTAPGHGARNMGLTRMRRSTTTGDSSKACPSTRARPCLKPIRR